MYIWPIRQSLSYKCVQHCHCAVRSIIECIHTNIQTYNHICMLPTAAYHKKIVLGLPTKAQV